jgi:hypothetical protein
VILLRLLQVGNVELRAGKLGQTGKHGFVQRVFLDPVLPFNFETLLLCQAEEFAVDTGMICNDGPGKVLHIGVYRAA